MADEINNLVLEHLRAIRSKLDNVERRLGNVEIELVQQGKLIAILVDGQQHIRARIAEIEGRLDRIERRLELRDEAPTT